MSEVKGQLNLEFVSSALLFLLSLSAVVLLVQQAIPTLETELDERSRHLEAQRVSEKMLSTPGNSTTQDEDWHLASPEEVTSFGLTNGSFRRLYDEKLYHLESYTFGSPGFNYSTFRNVTEVTHQYAFNLTYLPAILTPEEMTVAPYRNGTGGDFLEHYWRLEESSGSVINYATGSPGSASGALTRGVDGALDTRGVEFDGGEIQSNGAFNHGNRTLSVWVKPENFSTGWIAGVQTVGALNWKWGLRLDSGELQLVQRDTGFNVIYSEEIPRNEWVHLGATWNSSHNRLFVNGVKRQNGSFSTNFSSPKRLYVGDISGQDAFEGRIDEVRLYSRALSDPEFQRLKKGTDPFSWPGGEPVTLPVAADNGSTVRYGRTTVNGSITGAVLEANGENYDTVYVSRDRNFFSATPLREGDPLTLDGQEYRVAGVDPAGEFVLLSQNVKLFGPRPPNTGDTVRLDRYALYDNDTMRVEVIGW